jgi:Protein of unknown function (DUF2721)
VKRFVVLIVVDRRIEPATERVVVHFLGKQFIAQIYGPRLRLTPTFSTNRMFSSANRQVREISLRLGVNLYETRNLKPETLNLSNMELTIQTPALLFPAVSLLLIAYTNKFLAIAGLIRNLYSDYLENEAERPGLVRQISSLRRRVFLIRWMQVFGVSSILSCVITMFLIYAGWQTAAKILFAFSLLLMITSLLISLAEIFLSAGALRLLLIDLEKKEQSNKP